jgi:hypothetical protein
MEHDPLLAQSDEEKRSLTHHLDTLDKTIWQLAHELQGDGSSLLDLLRLLEKAHHNIREQYFQPTLPQNRQQLYALLREIEAEGGWPYIPRMHIRKLLTYLGTEIQ